MWMPHVWQWDVSYAYTYIENKRSDAYLLHLAGCGSRPVLLLPANVQAGSRQAASGEMSVDNSLKLIIMY
jgi:hypothetical protein